MTTGLHAVALCLTESADFNKEGNTCFLSGLGEAQLPVLALAGVFESVRLLPLTFLGILLSFFQLQFSFLSLTFVFIFYYCSEACLSYECAFCCWWQVYTSSILLWCLEFNRYIYTSYWQMNSIKDLNSWSSRLGCQRSITKGSFKNAFAKT